MFGDLEADVSYHKTNLQENPLTTSSSLWEEIILPVQIVCSGVLIVPSSGVTGSCRCSLSYNKKTLQSFLSSHCKHGACAHFE